MATRYQLSVIIAAHNAARTISEQLEALAGQQWAEPWEVLVVDNRSTDDTVETALGFRERLPNLRVVDAFARQGQAYAANTGVRAAKSDAVAFCDADDVVAAGWVAAMGDALKKHSFVSGPLETGRLNHSSIAGTRPHAQASGIQKFTYPPFLPHAGSSNMGVRRDVFEMVGGFDESLEALFDTDLCWKLQLRGVALTPLPHAVVHYRRRDKAGALLRQAYKYAEYDVALYKRYRPLGMPKLSKKSGVRAWINLVRGVPNLMREEARGRYLWQLGWRTGRLYGSIRHRVWAL